MSKKTLEKNRPVVSRRNAPIPMPIESLGIAQTSPASQPALARWTFLTNHSHVLILLSRNPSIVLREVATLVGITERAVQRIIAELEEENIIEREKVGRQNRYCILSDKPLRHPIESHRTVGDLLRAIDRGT